MKRFVVLLMILCLLCGTALAVDGDLPDLEVFANGLLEIDPDETEEHDYAIMKYYMGTNEDVLFTVNEYITLLTEKYGMDEICHFSITDENVTRVRFAFEYTKNTPKIGTTRILSDADGWEINGYQVYIVYSQSDFYKKAYVRINYRPEFNYIDTGDRIDISAKSTATPTAKPTATPTAKPTATPTAKPTATPTIKPTATPTAEPVECPECNGTGKCQTCGGDMWVWRYKWVYVNGFPESVMKNELCDAVYCTGGSCSKCGGDGILD